MKHAEILAPAGNMESFQAAVAAGADAVYMGLPAFGARAFARNFTLEEMEKIIQQAHLAGVKIYITMNTLLSDSQMEAAYEQALALYRMGVDALIVQDLGLIHYLHHRLPDLELHASTQISAITPAQIEKLKSIGISRVVLAREASLDEIRAAAQTGMELEVFVHGALCISYSGQCQFSRIRYGRSGNKGACAQPCRMEYTLYEDGKPVHTDGAFLLSPRDLSTLQDIPAMEKAGVASLKIEGRMKSPEYVYTSVMKARKAREGKPLSRQDEKEMMVTFNRGYTRGHMMEKTGEELMNTRSGNHQGLTIGEVIRTTPKKITIRLTEDLHQNDGIRFESSRSSTGMRVNFMYQNGRLVSAARAGETVEVDAVKGVYPGASVRKTVDSLLEKEVEHAVQQSRRQSKITFLLENEGAGYPLYLTASDGVHTVRAEGQIAQKALKRPVTAEDFRRQLAKTGNTWASPSVIDVHLQEDIFIPVKEINQLRNEAVELLAAQKLAVHAQKPLDYTYIPPAAGSLPSLIEVQRQEQIPVVQPEDTEVISEFPLTGTLQKTGIHESRTGHVRMSAHLDDADLIDGMNITNSYALAALLEMGYQGAVVSEETSEEELKELVRSFQERYGQPAPLIKKVYEHPRLMLMQHCPVNTALRDGSRSACALCRTHRYELEGKDGRKARLYGSPDCQMRLYDETATDEIDRISQYRKMGIDAFDLVLTTEDGTESQKLIEKFAGALKEHA